MKLGLADLADSRLDALVPEARTFYARRTAGRGPRSPNELATMRTRTTSPAPSNPPAVLEVLHAEGLDVPVRIHEPTSGAATGVLLEIHGGGFFLGSAAASDVANRALTDATGLAVVSVDYRLAPEQPWPAAPNDCAAAALWLADHARQRFGTTRLFIGGFSAGATLAATTLLRLRDREVQAYAGAVLQFGTYDLSGQSPAGRLIADEYFLDAYAGSVSDRTLPDFSPIYAQLAGLPPILMVVGAEDILLEDNLAMATRLSAARVDIDLRVYPASPHGFTGHATTMARAALDDMERWLTRNPSAQPQH